MRGRCTSALSLDRLDLLPADTEDEGHEEAQDLIGDEKKERSHHHHREDHDGRDDRLSARRPRDLGDLGPDLLQKYEWIRPRHLNSLPGATLSVTPTSPPATPCWQEWRDSTPQPPVLETGALAS